MRGCPAEEAPMLTSQPRVGLASREPAPDLSNLPQTLDELADIGLDMVELPLYAADLVIGGRILQSRLAELEATCRDRPFGFTVHGPLSVNFMGPPTHQQRFLDAAEAFVEICARIGASHLVLHAGMLLPDELAEAQARLDQQRLWLSRAGDIAGGGGVILCVENIFDYGGYIA